MIIVTGGAGFIGSNIVYGLNKAGYDDILIVDDLSDGHKARNMNALNFIDYVDKDFFINNLELFNEKNIDAIFHEGACADTMEWNGKYMLENNYEYSKKLLRFAIKKGISFIYASSASVYGNGEKGFSEKLENENPLNVYAFSKYLFDQYVRKLKRVSSVSSQIVGLRYFNVYGQQENHKGRMASTAYHFFHQLKEEGKAKLFEGSENFIRDFIYVDDVVDVNLFFFMHKEKNGIFNCGTGKAESFIEIAKTLIELEGKGALETIPFPEKLKGKYQKFTQADLENLRKIGYKKEFLSVKEGVKKYYKYLSENEGYLIR